VADLGNPKAAAMSSNITNADTNSSKNDDDAGGDNTDGVITLNSVSHEELHE
jgi:hypothetical protein